MEKEFYQFVGERLHGVTLAPVSEVLPKVIRWNDALGYPVPYWMRELHLLKQWPTVSAGELFSVQPQLPAPQLPIDSA